MDKWAPVRAIPGRADRERSGSQWSRTGALLVFSLALAIGLPQPPQAWGGESDTAPTTEQIEGETERDARLYHTNAERREIGSKRRLTSWLSLSGLVELELSREELYSVGSGSDEDQNLGAATIQLGLIATPWEAFKGEVVVEFDSETDGLFVEEAIASLDLEPWELEAGVQYLPFGSYVSHFASGPLLEFGETRARAASVSYAPRESLDISLSVYRGQARGRSSQSRPLNWAAALESWAGDSLLFGVSYLANLADADSRPLKDTNDRYTRKVPGFSAYLVWTRPEFEISLEALGATRAFAELEADRNQPRAWNLELVHFTGANFEWAARLEGSSELEDEPELRYGAAVTWRPARQTSITLEYLRGRFKDGFATNDDDEPLSKVEQILAQISIAF